MGIFGTPQEQVELDDLKARVAKLEQAVASLQAQVAAQLGAQVQAGSGAVPYGPASTSTPTSGAVGDPDWMAEVRALVASDDKIHAIKVYREHTGLGLKEAKDAVEAL